MSWLGHITVRQQRTGPVRQRAAGHAATPVAAGAVNFQHLTTIQMNDPHSHIDSPREHDAALMMGRVPLNLETPSVAATTTSKEAHQSHRHSQLQRMSRALPICELHTSLSPPTAMRDHDHDQVVEKVTVAVVAEDETSAHGRRDDHDMNVRVQSIATRAELVCFVLHSLYAQALANK